MEREEFQEMLDYERRIMKARSDFLKAKVDPLEVKKIVKRFIDQNYLDRLSRSVNYQMTVDIRYKIAHFDFIIAMLEANVIDFEKLAKFMNLSPAFLKTKPLKILRQAIMVTDDPKKISLELGKIREWRKNKKDYELRRKESKENEMTFRDILGGLYRKEAAVLCLRWGFFGMKKHTLEEIAKMFRVTRERIRQIEAKAMNKLEQPNNKNHPLRMLIPEDPR